MRPNKMLRSKGIYFFAIMLVFSSLLASNSFLNQGTTNNFIQNGLIALKSDMPSTRNSTFSGATTPTTMGVYLNATSISRNNISIQNSFNTLERSYALDISNYSLPGFSIYKVDVNISKNKVTAYNDWFFVKALYSSNYKKIQSNASLANLQMIAQNMSEFYRYQVNNLSLYFTTGTYNAGVPSPAIELWNATTTTGVPNKMKWTTPFSESSTIPGWTNFTSNYIVNASAPSNRTWFTVMNGTQWGSSKNNGNPANELDWYYANIVPQYKVGLTKQWGGSWSADTYQYALKYNRLYVNDKNNSARQFTPLNVALKMNTTAFNANGRASILGSNIKMLNFTANTSVSANMTLNLYYSKTVAAATRFSSNGGNLVNWNVTSTTPVIIPYGAKSRAIINMSIPSTWKFQVLAVYNGSSVASLASWSHYSNTSTVITITQIKSNSTWQIRCTSNNQITSIIERVNGVSVSQANLSSVINFSVKLKTNQNAGNMSLGVYYPTPNNTRVFTTSNASFGASINQVNLPLGWNTTGKPLGNYSIQARWNSTVDVGFLDSNFTIEDKMPPVTTLSNNGTFVSSASLYNINYTTRFIINASDVGTGVNRTSVTITGPLPSMTHQSWLFMSPPAGSNLTEIDSKSNWTGHFSFKDLSINATGKYNITYFSTDNIVGNIESKHFIIVNLTRYPPITTIPNNVTGNAVFSTVRLTSQFTINAIGVEAGIKLTNVTIQGQSPLTIKKSYIFLPGNSTFSFKSLNITTVGRYTVSWFSVDTLGNIETAHAMTANLTRYTTIQINSISQSGYPAIANYLSTVSAYYGKNATMNLSFLDDQDQQIKSPTLLNASLYVLSTLTWSYASTTLTGHGPFNIPLNIANLDVGIYSLVIIAKKTGMNNVTQNYYLLIKSIPVTITILNRTQENKSLVPSSSLVYVGVSRINLTILVAVNNSLDGTPITTGKLQMLYMEGAKVLYNISVSDSADGKADGIFTIVLPGSVQLIDTDAILEFQWITPSLNYNSTNTITSFSVRFHTQQIDWLTIAILCILLIMVAVVYNVVLRRVVIPRRLRRHNFLAKISSAFEDAANIQNVLIIHKASGTCLFFKAYGKSSLDPDLITGFLTAIQSFGAEMSGNKSLEELTWQDYQLVLGEGSLIRIALVLASKASGILKGLVPQFVAKYEGLYKDKLANWRGDLTSFRDSNKVISDVFDTAIILPHKKSDMPISPRSSLAKKILEVASALTKDRDYFFIATLLSESITKTKQSYAEIIAAIQELRKDNILIPIDIESLEKKKEITQPEIASLQQRVAQIPFLNPDEKAKLTQDLVKMSAEEREATLGSMTVMSQLQSATSQSIRGSEPGAAPSKQSGTITSQVPANIAGIKNKNEAMNRIKNIDKSAKICLKNYEYEGAIKLYEESEAIASQWNLKSMITELTHKKIDASIKDFQYKQTVVLTDAKNAEKRGDKTTAIQKYTEAANYSSSLFKLGMPTEDKKMREFIKKAESLKKAT